jgi:deoxyribodipyrimidine photo-lyase
MTALVWFRNDLRAVDWRDYDDATLLPPRSVRTLQGNSYKVYTPFRRAVLKLLGGGVLDCRTAPRPAERWLDTPTLPPYPYAPATVDARLWPAGEAAAAQRLQDFLAGPIRDYQTQRNFPALAGTSGLSPYLALGAISARRCAAPKPRLRSWRATLRAHRTPAPG